MCLVKDNEIVGFGLKVLKMIEHAIRDQRVHADDDPIAVGTAEGIPCSRILTLDDAERQTEQLSHLLFPVSHETGRRHDEYAADESARQHFADVQPRHDGLAGARVVRQ